MVSVTWNLIDFYVITEFSENDQHSSPKQDSGENVAISSTPITKLKNKGTRRGSKNSESGSDVREAWKCEDCKKIFKIEKDRVRVLRKLILH